MTQYEIYSLILCVVVFVLLVSVSVVCVVTLTKMHLKLIRLGSEDYKIIKEHEIQKRKKFNKVSKVIDYIVTAFLCVVFFTLFAGSLYINCTQNSYFENVPTYRVVMTGSMAKKHKDNDYLTKNHLDNQIQTFDLIATYKIPPQEELKLYDIIVYEVDDMLLVHRIVGIEEPNAKHPNDYYFLLQGDAVESPDRFPVLYSQMRGIYKNERIPFIGSFVLFMQSPAGWLCILLIAVALVAVPILENKIAKAKKERLNLIGRGE